MQPKIRIDTSEWTRTLAQYMRHTKKDLADVLNNKAYRIGWTAYKETHKAEAGKIRADFEREVLATREDGSQGMAPLGGVLVQKIRKRRDGAGWQHPKQLRSAVRAFINRRVRAIGYMRSGWMASINDLARFLGKPLRNDRFRASGRKRGGGIGAVPSWKPRAELYNQALAKRSTTGSQALEEFAGRALRIAIARETADMRSYIERKLQQTANRYTRR